MKKGQIGLEDVIGLFIGIAIFIALYPTMSSIIAGFTGDATTAGLFALVPAALVVWLLLIIFKKAIGRKTDENKAYGW